MRQYFSNAQKRTDQLVRSMRRDRLKRERESLTSDQIDDRITKVILRCAIGGGTVSERDILGANVPREKITKARFDRCFERAREIDPAIATVQAFA